MTSFSHDIMKKTLIPSNKTRHSPIQAKTGIAGPSASSGSALVLVLLLLSLLLALAVRERVSAHGFLTIENKLAVRTELTLAARDAAFGAITLLENAVKSGPEDTATFLSSPLNELLPNKIETIVTITDENRFFDVNLTGSVLAEKSPRFINNVLVAILSGSGVPDPEIIAGAITKRARPFREDATLSKAVSHPHETRSPISPAELAEILSTNLSSDFMTAAPPTEGGIRTINVNTADPFLLECLIGRENKQIADYLIQIRTKRPLTSLLILDGLENRVDTDVLKAILSTDSNLFSIVSRAERDGQKVEIYAMIDFSNEESPQIARWVKL